MSALPLTPLFIGGVEMMMIGVVILVLIFGSKATDIARDAGSAVGKVRKTRQQAEAEINDIQTEFEEGLEPVEEEVKSVEEEVKSVEEEVKSVEEDMTIEGETGSSTADVDRPDRSGARE
jgi:Sec-independent protein translocase protein TatA